MGVVPNSSKHHREAHTSDQSELTTISFAARTLVMIAERRKGVDASHSRLALLHIESSTLIYRQLRRVLTRHKLTDLQFTVLVILFSTEPEPLSASVLAEHAVVSRSAMTDAIDRLEAARFLTRSRDEFDRRVTYVRITPAGLDAIDRAINDYLQAAEIGVRELRPMTQRALFVAYIELLRALSKDDAKAEDGAVR